MPNIEFSSLVQEWFVKVRLDNECLWVAIFVLLLCLENLFNFVQSQTHDNAVSSVRKLSRLNNPYVFGALLFRRILPLLFVCLLLSWIKTVQKLSILRILEAILDMIRLRQILKRFNPHFLVIGCHCVKQCLFVAYDVIIGQMIVNFYVLKF